MLKYQSKSWVTPVIIIVSTLILCLDIATYRGTADYIFYFIPIAMTVFHWNAALPLIVAAGCTLLALVGFVLSPVNPNFNSGITFLNRTFAIFSMWVVGYLVRKIILARNETEKVSWVKEKATELAFSLRGELSLKQIADNILSHFSNATDSKVGSIYMRKEHSKGFEFLAGHAFVASDSKKMILPGEGVLGQAAIKRAIQILSPVDSHHVKLSSTLGDSELKHIIIVPLVVDDFTIALVELAYLSEPSPIYIELLNQVSESCAISLRSAQHKMRLAELLEQSQRHTEELQVQQEELRVSNEELEQQSKTLKETHARLENQQAELEQTNQQLEEQTQILENQKKLLNEKNRELQMKSDEVFKASKYKSEFLANMSHELRTPLNSTLILAKLLADNKSGTLSPEQVEYAEIIYNSGNDLLNLINDILDLSKVEAGKMTITPEVVQIESLMKSLEKMFLPVAEQKNLNFKIEIGPDTKKEIVTDRLRLEQILKNFLSNAFKFTERGKVDVHVFDRASEIYFSVIDSGVGMSPEEQIVVFEAFRQADGTINRKYGGTGLGLSISKELAQLLGGEIEVKSEKGKGSTFTLKIPLVYQGKVHLPQTNVPVISPAAKEEKPQKSHSSFNFQDDRECIQDFKRKMLIIEDDELFAKILYDLAREMKFGALVAETAEEGMAMAKKFQPNAIVLDIRLPDHSGMIILDQLKMNAKTRHIPVHVISAHDFSRSALEMGAMGYVLKPVRKDQLLSVFKNMSSAFEQEMKHVLIVEDDPVQRKQISELISDKDVQVTAVETSAEALKNLSEKTFDCMIMDLSLPDLSGHELLSKLSSESSTYSFPPVIVYTARDLTPEEEQKLRLYSGSIIIKGAKSPERLLSEVTLFLHKVETDLPPERQKMLKDLRSREKNLETRNILIVDDDVRNIFSLTAALEGHGAQITSARNGKEALKKINQKIDLVLMDIMMPEMDGYEAISKIRANEAYKDIPILALTAKAMKDDRQKCIEAGANDYLSKPIEIEKLLSLIRVWLPHKRRFT